MPPYSCPQDTLVHSAIRLQPQHNVGNKIKNAPLQRNSLKRRQYHKVSPHCNNVVNRSIEANNSPTPQRFQRKQDKPQSMRQKRPLSGQKKTTNTQQQRRASQKSQQIKRQRKSVSKRVSFSTVEVREYARCLGDNPSAFPDGPSLSIDWMYKTCGRKSVSQFEKQCQDNRKDKVSLVLNGEEREMILRTHTNCTDKEIEENIREMEKIRHHRAKSLLKTPFTKFQKVVKKCQRTLKIGKRTKQLIGKGV